MRRHAGLGLALAGLLVHVAAAGNTPIPAAGQPAPEIAGGPWVNSPALTMGSLRGRVVLVEFWTSG